MGIKDVPVTAITILHPEANWGVWFPLHTWLTRVDTHVKVQNFHTNIASGYVGNHGPWIVFKNHDDALLWLIEQ